VRYETLCLDTLSTLNGIFDFIGVDRRVALAPLASQEHHVIGNGMRFDRATDVRLDDRWKTALTGPAMETFQSVAGPLNRLLGYN
jgi:hypothetical protein